MTAIDPAAQPPTLRTEVLADGFVSVAVPAAWHVTRSPQEGIELIAVEPEAEPDQEGLFRANLVLTVAPIEMTFAEWQTGTDVILAESFADYLLLDLEKPTVGGHPGGRRLATYATKENESVTMQQWATLVDGRGVTLTATSSTVTHATHAALVAQVVASLEVGA